MQFQRKNPLIFEDFEDNGFMSPLDMSLDDDRAERLARAYREGDTEVIDAVIKGEVQTPVEPFRSFSDNTPTGFANVGAAPVEPVKVASLSDVTTNKQPVQEEAPAAPTAPVAPQAAPAQTFDSIAPAFKPNVSQGMSFIRDADVLEQEQLQAAKKLAASQTPEAIARAEATAKENAAINTLSKQILDQGTTSYWTGQGFGSPEANAKDMAKLLATAGITDITQFGKVDKYEAVSEIGKSYNGNRVHSNGEGGYYYFETTGEMDSDGNYVSRPVAVPQGAKLDTLYGFVEDNGENGSIYNPVDSSKVVMRNGVPMAVTGKTFGNVETGQEIESRSGRWRNQGGEDLFGGTGEGKGNTGYRVDFSNGIPLFYTTYGSSNDLVMMFQDNPLLGKIATAAAAYFGGPWAVAALQAAQGKSIEDIAKSAVLTYAGGEIAKGLSGSETLVNSFGQNTANIIAKATSQAVTSGGKIKIVDALVSSGLEAGTSEVLKNVDGFQELSAGRKTFVTNAVKTTIQNGGNLSADQLADAAIAAGITAIEESKKGINAVAIKADETVKNAVNEAISNTASTNEPTTSVFANKEIKSSITDEPPKIDTITAGNIELPNVMADALEQVKNMSSFNEAYSTARKLLGSNQVFEWNGKKFSTDTAAENPALANASIEAISARNLATKTNASGTVAAQSDTAARATAAEELAKQQAALKATEKTGFFTNLVNSVQDQMKLSSDAANDYLKNNPDSPITNSVSTAMEAAGNLQKNVAGGVSLLLDNKPLADAFVKSGDDMTKFGQSIGKGVVDTKNWNETMGLLEKASGWEKLGVMAGRIMDGTSGLGRQVEVELRQELPGLFLGGGSVKGILLATGAMDVAETSGNAALDAYDDAVKKGATHTDALADARKAGAAAGLAEAAIQLTLGKVADVVVGKIGNVAGKAGAKVLGEGFVEGGQEGSSSLAVNAILGQELDVNKALTQAVAGAAVGKGSSATTSPTDIAMSETINNNIKTAATSGDPASMNTAITNSVQQSLANGSSAEVAVGASVNSAITNGGDAEPSISAAVSSAIENNADVAQTVTASIDSAITAGANASVAINSTVTSAIKSGADITQTVQSSITAANAAGVNISTAITNTANSAITIALSNNVKPTIAITSSVTAAVNAAVSANKNVNANVNTAVNAAVDAAVNAGVDTNTAITSAIDAVINANINPNIKINIDAIKNTAIQTAKTAKEKVELISTVNNLISGNTPTTPTTASKGKKKAGEGQEGYGGFTFSGSGVIDPLKESFLKTYMTKDSFKDPLEKLREMQGAEQPADNQMMQQQIDPYLASILAERNATQSEPEPEAPQSPPLWSFGQEPDSIDAMLAPKAPVEPVPEKAFKSGGFVAPLQMASGGSSSGSMALPLLAKSGGALGALQRPDGRMDFRHGAHVAGDGDGQSDDIKAMLADGEFVFPADVVSALGNGSTKAGSDKLYEMMHAIRNRARSTGKKDLPPPALKSPLDYLKKGSKK